MKSLVFVLLFIPAFSFAQYEPEKSFRETYAYGCDPDQTAYAERPVCGVVIALSGLKLRDKPAFDAKTLAVIPFGEIVERTEKGYDLSPANWQELLMTPDSIRGYFQEISWRGKKGFAFSTFIGDAIYRMNESVYLLFENGGWCWNDCYASPAYHYYGLFTNRDSSRWDLQKIKPTFCFDGYEMSGTSIRADSKKRPAFIIAAKKPIAEGLVMTEKKTATIFERRYFHDSTAVSSQKVNVPLSQFSLSVTTSTSPEYGNRQSIHLTEKSSGRKQVLQSDFYLEKVELIWTGDLDKDGIIDFMLSYSDGHSYGCQLFLSGFATGKQLVKPMKIYWFSDCC